GIHGRGGRGDVRYDGPAPTDVAGLVRLRRDRHRHGPDAAWRRRADIDATIGHPAAQGRGRALDGLGRLSYRRVVAVADGRMVAGRGSLSHRHVGPDPGRRYRSGIY